MKKIGQIGRIKPECIEEYIKLHQSDIFSKKWQQVRKTIHQCNIKNYSIFIQDDVVFACFEYYGDDFALDMEKMAEDKATQQWWKLTRPCFTLYKADSKEAFYTDMQEIFFFE